MNGLSAREEKEEIVVFVDEGEGIEFELTEGRRMIAMKTTKEMFCGIGIKEIVFNQKSSETKMRLKHAGEGKSRSIAKGTIVHLQ